MTQIRAVPVTHRRRGRQAVLICWSASCRIRANPWGGLPWRRALPALITSACPLTFSAQMDGGVDSTLVRRAVRRVAHLVQRHVTPVVRTARSPGRLYVVRAVCI